MRKRACLAAGGSLLAATISLFGAAASASAGTATPVVGYTYVNDNTAAANTVAGFARHADGSLTPIPGSPFAIGGAGLGAGLSSQGAIQATPDGKFLLAVDAGSNQISVLRVTADGVPKPVGPPVSSGGVEPVSIAISRFGLVYVANAGNGGSNNYVGFRFHFNGTLTPIPGSTVTGPAGSGVADVLFNATGDHLVGTRVNTSLIDSFVVLPGGPARPGISLHRARPRSDRRGVLACRALAVVRQQRAQRRRPGHRVRVPRRLFRSAFPDRIVALCRRADRTMLGGDHPRRQVPVRGQHRVGQHLQLLHQLGRLARAGWHRAHHRRGRLDRCPLVS